MVMTNLQQQADRVSPCGSVLNKHGSSAEFFEGAMQQILGMGAFSINAMVHLTLNRQYSLTPHAQPLIMRLWYRPVTLQ